MPIVLPHAARFHVGGHGTRCPIHLILGFWGAKFTKVGDSLPWMPMNCSAKFEAASFKQTVTEISTCCLLACVDN